MSSPCLTELYRLSSCHSALSLLALVQFSVGKRIWHK